MSLVLENEVEIWLRLGVVEAFAADFWFFLLFNALESLLALLPVISRSVLLSAEIGVVAVEGFWVDFHLYSILGGFSALVVHHLLCLDQIRLVVIVRVSFGHQVLVRIFWRGPLLRGLSRQIVAHVCLAALSGLAGVNFLCRDLILRVKHFCSLRNLSSRAHGGDWSFVLLFLILRFQLVQPFLLEPLSVLGPKTGGRLPHLLHLSGDTLGDFSSIPSTLQVPRWGLVGNVLVQVIVHLSLSLHLVIRPLQLWGRFLYNLPI